ncbi:tetratricopeptide repeat protein [bacterium]|nr:tetratricopeptide repeat protein [bacterium]
MEQSPANATLPEIDKLWNFGDPAASEAAFSKLLEDSADAASTDYAAQLLTQIARTHGLRADFTAAQEWLEKAEILILEGEERGEDMRVSRVRLGLERGRTLNSSGDPAAAVPVFELALELAQTAGLENYACDAAHMLGIACPGDAGLEWNLRAIAMAEAAKDEQARKWLGPLYNNTGWSLHELGRYDEALALWEKSVDFRLAQNPTGMPARIAKWTVARCLRSMGRYQEALDKQLALQAEFEALGEADGYVFEEIGENLLALGRPEDARPHFARAYELLSQLSGLEKLEDARLARLKEHGGA